MSISARYIVTNDASSYTMASIYADQGMGMLKEEVYRNAQGSALVYYNIHITALAFILEALDLASRKCLN